MKGYIKAREFIERLASTLFKLNFHVIIRINYNAKVPINYKKLEDVSKVVHYIPDDFMPFYDKILTKPTTKRENSDNAELNVYLFFFIIF